MALTPHSLERGTDMFGLLLTLAVLVADVMKNGGLILRFVITAFLKTGQITAEEYKKFQAKKEKLKEENA